MADNKRGYVPEGARVVVDPERVQVVVHEGFKTTSLDPGAVVVPEEWMLTLDERIRL